MKKTAFVMVILMLLHTLSLSVIAEREKTDIQSADLEAQQTETTVSNETENTVVDVEDISEPPISAPAAASYTYATTNKATALVSAPYDGINVTIANLSAGATIYIVERDYEYFLVYRQLGEKYQWGYVKMADVNYSSYSWVNHNLFQRGTTAFTSSSQQVLCGPGTATTFTEVGTIYQNEYPLLLLRTEVNPYNNVTYCLIQYKVTGTEQFKRGWVPYSAVRMVGSVSDTDFVDENTYFYFESAATNKMIQATGTTSGSSTNQQPSSTSNLNQLFKVEISSPGYYRFILQSNPALSLQVLGNQMKEGATIGVATKGSATAPTKAEEFEITVTTDGAFYLKSRCTGLYRAVDLYAGYGANGTAIISSKVSDGTNQQWRFQPRVLQGNDLSIIKVGDSTGRACMLLYNAFSNRNIYYANREKLVDTTNVSENTRFTLPHIRFAIKNSSFFYINGHGYSQPYIVGSNVSPSYQITPSGIGFSTNDRTRWGILGPCNQLNQTGSAITWANYALRNGVRGLLGYYGTAPHDNGPNNQPQVDKMELFVDNMENGDSFVTAWKNANNGFLGQIGDTNWAAIYHAAAENDSMSSYNNRLTNPTTSTIYYLSKEVSETTLNTSSTSMTNLVPTTENVAVSLQKNAEEWTLKESSDRFEKKGYDIVKTDAVTIDQSAAQQKIGTFVKDYGIELYENFSIEKGAITRSELSADGTCFVNKQVLAYTFTLKPTVANSRTTDAMYFEVTDDGVVNYISAS